MVLKAIPFFYLATLYSVQTKFHCHTSFKVEIVDHLFSIVLKALYPINLAQA